MKKKMIVLAGLVSVLFAFRSATDLVTWPDYFPEPVYNFNSRPLSQPEVNLGRQLFYDPVLSLDSSTSCASCHSPYNAFAHVDHKLSHGIYDSIGRRNAPALSNLAWQKVFMWDGAVNHIEVQALAPMSNPIEMHESIAHVVEKLKRSKFYPALFQEAFGDSGVTGHNVLMAIAQFELSLVSQSSRYDSVMQKTASFTPQEENGYRIFKAHCNVCHAEPLFSTYEFASNGLPVDPFLNDYGRFGITQNPKDSFLFKIPSLRNVAYTYPYMHDGRFRKLLDVVNYYTGDIQKSPYLSPQLRQPIVLSADEKIDLVAFLLTLSDKKFIFDNRFGPPPRRVQ